MCIRDSTNLLPHIIKNVFKKLNINVFFKTTNNLRNFFRHNEHSELENNSGVYKIVCDDCDMFYIGQTGRKFKDRFREHIPKGSIRYTTSNFALHLINNNHRYTSCAKNLKPLHICNKGRIMSALEEFEIYKASRTQKNLVLNDQLSFNSNSLYDTALQHVYQIIDE